MADNILYFPYINLPKSPWTMRTLLYYNTISAIVPRDFIEDRGKYDNFMQELVKEHLVIPLDPLSVLDQIWQLNDPFMQFINLPTYNLEQKRLRFQRFSQTKERSKFNPFKPALISKEKFDHSLIERLEEIGLAKHAFDRFYEVEKVTAQYLMAYLSSIVANKKELLPVTDTELTLKSRMSFKGKAIDKNITNRRMKVLEQILPMPGSINISKILDFKYDYQPDLFFFRNMVEQIALDEKYENEDLLTYKTEELIHYRNILTEQMKKRNLGNILFGNIFGLISAGIGIASTGSPFGAFLGTPSFINSVHSALKLEDPEKQFDSTGMKYLALINKRLI